MAISDTCKFELKSNVDRLQKARGGSRRKAIALLADELGLLSETARKADQRARKELGQIVPKKPKPKQVDPMPAEPAWIDEGPPLTDIPEGLGTTAEPDHLDDLPEPRRGRKMSEREILDQIRYLDAAIAGGNEDRLLAGMLLAYRAVLGIKDA